MVGSIRRDYNGNKVQFPQELLSQILCFLPDKSLARFRSVCKSWLSLIQSAYFMHQHRRHCHKMNYDNRILMYGCHKDFSSPLRTLNFSLLSDHYNTISIDLDVNFNPHFPPNTWFDDFNMLSWGGIVCLYYHDKQYTIDPYHQLTHAIYIFLWNPATRKIRALPAPNALLPRVSNERSTDVGVGFGFDTESNDYKVVMIAILNSWMREEDEPVRSQVEVYSLSTDSWRTLDVVLPVDAIISNVNEPLSDGRIFCWSGRRTNTDIGECEILWFDFSKEVFGSIAFPDRISRHRSLELAIVKENIASIVPMEEDGRTYEVWKMGEFGVVESWTCLYRIRTPWERVVSILNDGESLLIVYNGSLYINNIFTQETKYVPLQKDFSGEMILKDVSYNECLLAVKEI